MAVRQGVGLFDMTSFGKIRVEGRDAAAFLNHVCANEVDVPAGRVVYTQMLNARGGIESDLTVTRLSETAFLLVVPGATLRRDLAWLRTHVADRVVTITDMTAAEAVFCVMGPKARDLLQDTSPDDLSNAGFPFGTARGDRDRHGAGPRASHLLCRRTRLGAFYVSTDQAAHVFETLTEAGAGHDLKTLRSACARLLPDREGIPPFRP